MEKLTKKQKQVLDFIKNFKNGFVENNNIKGLSQNLENDLEILFSNGYCYHFAQILKNTFNRGEICNTYPYGHIVWMDNDNTPYDIHGINYSECDYYIPERYLKEHIEPFKHNGSNVVTSEDDIEMIEKEYLGDIFKKHQEETKLID